MSVLRPLDLLDVLGMEQQRRDAGLGDGVENRLPVDARAFHRRRRHTVRAEPVGKGGKPARKGAELLVVDLCIRICPGNTHRRRDLHLVHVNAGSARVDDMERVCRYHGTSSFGWNIRGSGRVNG